MNESHKLYAVLANCLIQKLIKELPSLVPMDEGKMQSADTNTNNTTVAAPQQNHGDFTGEVGEAPGPASRVGRSVSTGGAPEAASTTSNPNSSSNNNSQSHDAATIGKSPGEVAFFKLLH